MSFSPLQINKSLLSVGQIKVAAMPFIENVTFDGDKEMCEFLQMEF